MESTFSVLLTLAVLLIPVIAWILHGCPNAEEL